MPSTLVDSGPLVALFNRKDRHHAEALAFVERAKGELITNIPVVVEVAFLLSRNRIGLRNALKWIPAATMIDSHTPRDLTRINDVIEKYADLPADFADASLVAMAERLNIRRIATVDSDFTVYRINGKQPFENVFWPVK
jgi:uncharacterized protein